VSIPPPVNVELTDGLPERTRALIGTIFADYVNRLSLDRFYRDVLLRLCRKEIGLFWFKEKLTKQASGQAKPITEEEWDEFLVNEDGQSIKAERLFQLHLALANLYRVKKFREK
jgi:hypothetical protein